MILHERNSDNFCFMKTMLFYENSIRESILLIQIYKEYMVKGDFNKINQINLTKISLSIFLGIIICSTISWSISGQHNPISTQWCFTGSPHNYFFLSMTYILHISFNTWLNIFAYPSFFTWYALLILIWWYAKMSTNRILGFLLQPRNELNVLLIERKWELLVFFSNYYHDTFMPLGIKGIHR